MSFNLVTVCRRSMSSITLTLLTCVLADETKCVRPKERTDLQLFVCNATAKLRTFSACCFNAELNYHYCCSPTEFSSMTQLKRVGGAIFGGTLVVLLILFLCFFSNRCPIRRAICKRRANVRAPSNPANVS